MHLQVLMYSKTISLALINSDALCAIPTRYAGSSSQTSADRHLESAPPMHRRMCQPGCQSSSCFNSKMHFMIEQSMQCESPAPAGAAVAAVSVLQHYAAVLKTCNNCLQVSQKKYARGIVARTYPRKVLPHEGPRHSHDG